MQVAINSNIYNSAQVYAQRKGLTLTQIIEDYLAQLVASAKVQKPIEKHREIEITPTVARLKTGHSWNITDEELDNLRYEHIMEKYK